MTISKFNGTPFTRAEVIQQMTEIVTRSGEDTVRICQYKDVAHTDEGEVETPHCGVGVWVYTVAPDVFEQMEDSGTWGNKTGAHSPKRNRDAVYDDHVDGRCQALALPEAHRFLDEFQRLQDRRAPWGEALRSAILSTES